MILNHPAPLNIWYTHLNEPDTHIWKEVNLTSGMAKSKIISEKVVRPIVASTMVLHIQTPQSFDIHNLVSSKTVFRSKQSVFQNTEIQKPFWSNCCFADSYGKKPYAPKKNKIWDTSLGGPKNYIWKQVYVVLNLLRNTRHSEGTFFADSSLLG